MDSVDKILRYIYILAAFVVLKTIKKVTGVYGIPIHGEKE